MARAVPACASGKSSLRVSTTASASPSSKATCDPATAVVIRSGPSTRSVSCMTSTVWSPQSLLASESLLVVLAHAVLVMVPSASAVVVMVTVRDAPADSVPRSQVTVAPLVVHGAEAPTNARPAGMVSVTITAAAVLRLLVTVTVNTTSSPSRTLPGPSLSSSTSTVVGVVGPVRGCTSKAPRSHTAVPSLSPSWGRDTPRWSVSPALPA